MIRSKPSPMGVAPYVLDAVRRALGAGGSMTVAQLADATGNAPIVIKRALDRMLSRGDVCSTTVRRPGVVDAEHWSLAAPKAGVCL